MIDTIKERKIWAGNRLNMGFETSFPSEENKTQTVHPSCSLLRDRFQILQRLRTYL